MSIRNFSGSAAARIQVALWLVGILMLVAFPLQRAHSSLSHFRAHEVRRSLLRHTLLERTPQSATAAAACQSGHGFARLIGLGDQSEPAIDNRAILTPPVKFFLTRLRLATSGAGSQDPLLD